MGHLRFAPVALAAAVLTSGCGGEDAAPVPPMPMDRPPTALAEPVRIQPVAGTPILLARGVGGDLLRARWDSGKWSGWQTVAQAFPSFGHATDPTLLGHSFVTGLSLSEDLGATFRRIGAVPPTADIGIDNPARANVETTPARDGHRIAACIASRSDLPEPIWLRTSANLGQTWGSPVPVPGIRSRDRGAFSERQIALAVHGDRIVIAGLAKDGRDWILTVIQATATGAAITMPDPPRQLRIPGLSWTSLGLWSDDRGAVVILAWEGLTLVPVMDGRPLTPHRIVAGHRVDGIDLLRLPGDRFAVVWSDDRHGHPVGFPSPLSDRPRSDHEDVHAASLGGNGSVRSVQISTTGSHSHSPVLGRVGDRSVVVWVEHQLRASRNETGARGAPIAIRMRSLHD